MNAQIAHLERPGDAWPPLVPLDTPELPALHADWLPSWAGDFAAALAAETETPAELPAALVLASCATAAARRLRVLVRPGWFEPCNLWLVCALPPGNRKSAVQRAACEPLMTWERQQARDMDAEIKRADSDRKTQEARAKALRAKAASEKDRANARQLAEEAADIEEALVEVPKVPQLWTSDATPERLGMLLADNGERMAWLSSEGGVFDLLGGRYSSGIPNLDLVLKAHSGDFERVDRGSRPPVHLHCPLLSIGLAPQPEVLRGLMTKPGFHGRGLLARFLYLLPPSPLGYRSGEGQPVPDAARAAYTEGLRRMLEWPAKTDDHGEERPHLLRLEAEAAAELREFSQHIETSMRPGGACEHATDWAGKAPGTAARIAGVLHGIQHAHGEPWEHAITGETMQQEQHRPLLGQRLEPA